MDMTKNNAREILRISNPFHPTVFRDTVRSLEDRKAEEERRREREEENELREVRRKEREERLEQSRARLEELRQRRLARSSENPATSSQSAGGGGSASYEAFKKEQQSEFRRLADTEFNQTIDHFIQAGDLTGLKRFVSQQGGNAGYNSVITVLDLLKQ
jgi:hypothetical protein